jgi:hypothetical protein
MEKLKTRHKSDEELDLGQLFLGIGRAFKNLAQSILNGIAGMRSLFVTNLAFFLLVMGSGVALALAYSTLIKKRHYTSSMIISCRYLNMRIVGNAMEKLNLLCEEKDRQGLSQVLGIDVNAALNIRGFDARSFVSETDRMEVEVLKTQLNHVAPDKKELVAKVIEKIEIENSQSFQIDVSVFQADVVKALDSALVFYFKGNEFVAKRIHRNQESLLERKTKLVGESKKLDSLKSVLYANFQTMSKQTRAGSNNVILSDKYLTDPLKVFEEDLDLNNEIRSIDDQLTIRPDFEVVDRLTTFKEPSDLSLPVFLALSLMVSVALGYILIGLWKFNKYLAALTEKDDREKNPAASSHAQAA